MQDIIKSKFRYEDGNLFRLHDSGGQKSGSIAGWITECNGKKYRKMMINRKTFYVHHAIFLFHFGYLPKVIDHINRNTLDNKIENLRAADQQKNVANSGMRKNNTSGIKGVYWDKNKNKWVAQITVNGKCIKLGKFDDIDLAANEYSCAAEKYFGEFSFACMSQEASNRRQDNATR